VNCQQIERAVDWIMAICITRSCVIMQKHVRNAGAGQAALPPTHTHNTKVRAAVPWSP